LRVHTVLKGTELAKRDQRFDIPAVERLKPGALCLVWGTRQPADNNQVDSSRQFIADHYRWNYRPVTETSYAYFARSPALRIAAAERLRYFAHFLENSDPAVADDAYLEFGHAPYDVVAQAADALPLDKIRSWLLDESVPQERKGFYGLALGLSREPATRAANLRVLQRLVNEPSDDFRAGFGGILGGLLLASGESGLDLIDRVYLSNAGAADGDVRSALGALRFYHEFGKEVSTARQTQSLRQLLARREFASEAIVDLARWQDWDSLDAVVDLYDAPAEHQPGLRRAVVGYLFACPDPKATEELVNLRNRDPRGVGEAEVYLKSVGSLR
jgi:hypothetical protein